MQYIGYCIDTCVVCVCVCDRERKCYIYKYLHFLNKYIKCIKYRKKSTSYFFVILYFWNIIDMQSRKRFLYVCICLYIYGGGVFDPLLILYIWPLTKTLSVYNYCNGRFIWTVRDRITTKNPEKLIFKKLYFDLHFNEWNKYLTPSQNTT